MRRPQKRLQAGMMLCDVCEIARDGMRAPVAGHGIPADGKEEYDKRRRRRWNGP
jgi:hypothetical protein